MTAWQHFPTRVCCTGCSRYGTGHAAKDQDGNCAGHAAKHEPAGTPQSVCREQILRPRPQHVVRLPSSSAAPQGKLTITFTRLLCLVIPCNLLSIVHTLRQICLPFVNVRYSSDFHSATLSKQELTMHIINDSVKAENFECHVRNSDRAWR